MQDITFAILRPVEAEYLFAHADGAPDLVPDPVRGDGDLGHHAVGLSEQPQVPVVDRPVSAQPSLRVVHLVEGGVGHEGRENLGGELLTFQEFARSLNVVSCHVIIVYESSYKVPFRRPPTS